MNTENAIIGPNPEKVKGCKFCGATSVKYDARGRAWWHPSTDCCAPAAVLQLVWRARDARLSGETHDAALDARVKAELGRILDDDQKDERAALEAFRHHVRSEDDLRAAIAEVRERGYVENFGAAVAALRRRAA